jgi:hypothetical protein
MKEVAGSGLLVAGEGDVVFFQQPATSNQQPFKK